MDNIDNWQRNSNKGLLEALKKEHEEARATVEVLRPCFVPEVITQLIEWLDGRIAFLNSLDSDTMAPDSIERTIIHESSDDMRFVTFNMRDTVRFLSQIAITPNAVLSTMWGIGKKQVAEDSE